MKQFKLSYTILNAWASGKQEDAVAYWLGKDIPATPAMELGRLKHKQWELFAAEKKRLPDELGGDKLINPLIEQKYRKVLPFNDEFEILLSGILDVEDITDGYDYKCGKGKAATYVASMQAPIYQVLRPHLKRFTYICFNPYTKEVERGLVFLTDKTQEDALNYIYTYGGEILNYLQVQKLIK